MRNRNRFAPLFAFVVVVLGLGGVAHAQYPMPPMGMQQPMMPMPGIQPMNMPNPLAMLQLSQEQMQKLAEIGNAARDQSMAMMKSMGEAAQKLPNLMSASAPDPKAIGALYGQMFDIQRQMIEAAIATYNKQLTVLTKEQRERWEAMRQQMPGFPAAPR